MINTNLFTVPNVLAIGAIAFFWACIAYSLTHVGIASSPATPGSPN